MIKRKYRKVIFYIYLSIWIILNSLLLGFAWNLTDSTEEFIGILYTTIQFNLLLILIHLIYAIVIVYGKDEVDDEKK